MYVQKGVIEGHQVSEVVAKKSFGFFLKIKKGSSHFWTFVYRMFLLNGKRVFLGIIFDNCQTWGNVHDRSETVDLNIGNTSLSDLIKLLEIKSMCDKSS